MQDLIACLVDEEDEDSRCILGTELSSRLTKLENVLEQEFTEYEKKCKRWREKAMKLGSKGGN